MTWDVVEKDFVASNLPDVDAHMSSTGGGKRKRSIYLTVRAHRLDGVKWFADGQTVSVMIGRGAHAGTLRIIPGGQYRLRKLGKCGPGPDNRGVVLISPELHRALQVSSDAHPATAVEIDWSDTWLEVTLPSWAAPIETATVNAPTVPEPAPPVKAPVAVAEPAPPSGLAALKRHPLASYPKPIPAPFGAASTAAPKPPSEPEPRKPGKPFRGLASRTGLAGSAGVASSPIPIDHAR